MQKIVILEESDNSNVVFKMAKQIGAKIFEIPDNSSNVPFGYVGYEKSLTISPEDLVPLKYVAEELNKIVPGLKIEAEINAKIAVKDLLLYSTSLIPEEIRHKVGDLEFRVAASAAINKAIQDRYTAPKAGNIYFTVK